MELTIAEAERRLRIARRHFRDSQEQYRVEVGMGRAMAGVQMGGAQREVRALEAAIRAARDGLVILE